MVNRFICKLVHKLWLVNNINIIDDVKPLLLYYLICVEKHRTFKAPKVNELINQLHVDRDGYPIYVNKDGIVFQHLYKIPIDTLKSKVYRLANTIKYHNNIIYNYNYYRDDCYFIINIIKSYIQDIISIIPIKISYRVAFYQVTFYDYLITCC